MNSVREKTEEKDPLCGWVSGYCEKLYDHLLKHFDTTRSALIQNAMQVGLMEICKNYMDIIGGRVRRFRSLWRAICKNYIRNIIKYKQLLLYKDILNGNEIENIKTIFDGWELPYNDRHEGKFKMILKEIELLTHKQKRLVELKLAGISNGEIAKELKIKLGTVRSTYNQVKKKIMKKIGNNLKN